ncbi:MAG: ATP-binding protein [Bacteroidota bacterium]
MRLTSNPKNIARVESFLANVIKDYNISEEVYGNMLISLTEAVTNAMMHGNKADEKKIVRVTHQAREKQLVFKISDEGKGFNPNDVPDPTAPENLLKLGGRGVFLMRKLADRVNFLNNGSTVEIQFRLR